MTREEAARRLREKAEDQYYVPRLRELYLMAAEALEEEPRPEGKWEAYPNELYLRCSVCRKEFYIGHFPLTKKYCPNCGAKMEE